MSQSNKTIKCVVWDLDNTIWDGVLLEGNKVQLKPEIVQIIIELDKRGILHSIASKNTYENTMEKLTQFGIQKYFLFPQINWSAKSISIEHIAKALNLSLDSFAFIDDQDYELEEVSTSHPEVLCIHANSTHGILYTERFNPRFITEDSQKRRLMYIDDIKRKSYEEEFQGPKLDFLKSLNMEMSLSEASEEDLRRVEELTLRTHQLNTTGYTFTYDELLNFLQSPNYMLHVYNLKDRFGDYGKIGICLIEMQEKIWTIKLFLLSCRVMSRGLSEVALSHICNLAKEKGVRLYAEFLSTEHNKIMYITYKFNGFKEAKVNEDELLLECNLSKVFSHPDYIKINIFKKK
ncbi:MAG: HAD-IIIC family phosphatase [Eubacteriales bacterium]|nr:HAD-IIIC family phosphatase [Eubacteriales bacterium]